MSGKSEARELVTEAFLPEQQGQPDGPRSAVRLDTSASHSWSGALGHNHQISWFEPGTTWSGVRSPFFVGCHCAATLGNREARELLIETFRPRQNGQPAGWALLVRALIVACHSWSACFEHFHHTFLLLPGLTLSGVRLPFLDECHSATSSGNNDAKELLIETFCPAQKGQPLPSVRL
jgi:hypothetical protein